ncbi:MAG: hypothetical protein IPH40_03945 [Polaromonas sp.]|nr:hypothetical protein [Polaromonas sp.]
MCGIPDEAEGGQGSGDSDPNKDSGSGGKNQMKGKTLGLLASQIKPNKTNRPNPSVALKKRHLQQQWQRYGSCCTTHETGEVTARHWRGWCDAAIATQISWRAVLAQYLSISGALITVGSAHHGAVEIVAANQVVMWRVCAATVVMFMWPWTLRARSVRPTYLAFGRTQRHQSR